MGKNEQLRIVHNRAYSSITATLTSLKFKDKETKQYVYYFPSFEVSGYGKTEDKAKEMCDVQIRDILSHLIKLKPDAARAYLRKYGWIPERFAAKNFSHAYVDKDGVLQNFNLDPEEVLEETVKIEEKKLVAA